MLPPKAIKRVSKGVEMNPDLSNPEPDLYT